MYCSKCGNLVADGVAFCPACGQPALSISASANAGIPAGASPVAALPAGNHPPATPYVAVPVVYGHPSVQFAGFWLRVVAYLIDGVIMGLGFMALFIPFAVMVCGNFTVCGFQVEASSPAAMACQLVPSLLASIV